MPMEPLTSALDLAYRRFLQPVDAQGVDFSTPVGETALCPADSVSWQVCKNPVTLMIGGVAAVILELAEPRVRCGVWRHTNFRAAPVERMRRTGLATMVTVYGARSRAERLIAGVCRRHAAVRGLTPDGQVYDATDPELLDWVQATAAVSFLDAWQQHVRPLSQAQRDAYLAEGRAAGALFGATWAPSGEGDWQLLLERMLPKLGPSPVIHEFLRILSMAPLLPAPMRPLQRLLLRAALQGVAPVVRQRIGLDDAPLGRAQRRLVETLARAADTLVLPSSPPVQACRRLGLPDRYLYEGCHGRGPEPTRH